MIPTTFEYVAPTSVDEALAALAEGGDDAKVIAGGQSLLPSMKLGLAAPEALGLAGKDDLIICPAGALLHYLNDTQKVALRQPVASNRSSRLQALHRRTLRMTTW